MNSSCESTISTLLSTNRPPTLPESVSIQTDIDDLLREMGQLEARLRDLNAELQKRHAILSPLRRLPTELLGEIFSTMMPSILDEKGRRQLVDLQLVCREWRDASHLVNGLWSGIEVLPSHSVTSYERIVTWLGRSGSLPKSLHWTPRYSEGDSRFLSCCTRSTHSKPSYECSLVKSTVVRLLAEGPRIDTLRLRCDHTDCFRYLVRAIQDYRLGEPNPRPWNSLTALTIVFENAWSDWVDRLRQIDGPLLHLIPPVVTLNIQFPHDTDVFSGFLTDVLIERSKSAVIDVPPDTLNSLTTLTFTCDWAGDHLLKILQQCPNLSTLTVDLNNPSFFPGFGHRDDRTMASQLRPSPVLLPNLHTLRSRMSEDLSVLRYLKVPKLVSLDIAMLGGDYDGPLEAPGFSGPILELGKQSGILESLRYLRLSYLHPSAEDLTLILTTFPFITHLALDRLTLAWHELWGEMAHLADSGRECLPALEKLEVLQVPSNYPCDMCIYFFSQRKAKQRCHLVMSYGTVHEKRWDETAFEKAIEQDGVNMKAYIVPPVNYYMEGVEGEDSEEDVGA